MAKTKHDKIAEKLAKIKGTEYNKGQGPDVKTNRQIIEVAVHEADLRDSKRQLQGFKKPRYIATTPEMIKKAKEETKGTGIGVMGPTGYIHKKAKKPK